jgi:UDP-N-acetylmuramyl pentapeptide phosphotransferase/UDP-N-acetylglucosamine-1-phosphate transferase
MQALLPDQAWVGVILAVCFLLSLGLNRLMIWFAPSLGLMDQPGERRVHEAPVARAGGIAVWLSFMACMWAGRLWLPTWFGGVLSQQLLPFTIASVVLMSIGVIDDRFGLRPWVKLNGQILASVVFFILVPPTGSAFGIEVPRFLEGVIFVSWAVLLINAFNLIDGLDGLCGGLAAISLVVVATFQFAGGDRSDALVLAIMAAAVAGFLKFNLNPARIFLGDAGSMLLGFTLATVATQVGGRRAVLASILLPVAVAGVPLLDLLLAVWRRGTRNVASLWRGGSRVKLFGADKDHLHHRLLARGMSQRKVVLLMQGMAILIAALMLVPMLVGEKGILVTVCGLMILALFGLRHVAQVELVQTGSLVHLAVKRRSGFSTRRIRFFVYDLIMLVLAVWSALILGSQRDDSELIRGEWLRYATAFVALQMTALHLQRIYTRIWSRALPGEFLLIAIGLILGGVAADLVTSMVGDAGTFGGMRTTVPAIAISIFLLLLPRALPQLLRELALDSTHRRLTRRKNNKRQLLVYGAGDVGNLFVRYLMDCDPGEFADYQVSGFLDDFQPLKGRSLAGFPIFGGLDVLDELCREYTIHGILIAIRHLDPQRLREIRAEAQRLGLEVHIWGEGLESRMLD